MPTSKVVQNFELKTKRLPNGDRTLIGPLKVKGFRTALPNLQVPTGDVSRGMISVDSGFITDFSSVPTPLHWVVRWSSVDIAGVVHDFSTVIPDAREESPTTCGWNWHSPATRGWEGAEHGCVGRFFADLAGTIDQHNRNPAGGGCSLQASC